jgi:hypothetical protein
VAQAQSSLRRRILRASVGRCLLQGFAAQELLRYKHSGFSVDTSVCIAAYDSAGLERLLRCCARPAFALDRQGMVGRELIYRCAKQHSKPCSDRRNQRKAKRDIRAAELHLTPLELIDRLTAQVPPPHAYRHWYDGVLVHTSLVWAAVVTLAAGHTGVAGTLTAQPKPPYPVPPKRSEKILWAVLIARIYEVLPLLCLVCVSPDPHHRVHHLKRQHPAHPGVHRRREGVNSHPASTRATAVG